MSDIPKEIQDLIDGIVLEDDQEERPGLACGFMAFSVSEIKQRH